MNNFTYIVMVKTFTSEFIDDDWEEYTGIKYENYQDAVTEAKKASKELNIRLARVVML